MTTDKNKLYSELGYTNIKILEDGTVLGLQKFIFTTGLMVNIAKDGCYQHRFCFEDHQEAIKSLEAWDGTNDPTGPWIKEKGQRGERNNPQTFKEIPITIEKTRKLKM